MGTAGILGFIINGVRHGSYNRFDSYPQVLGRDIVRFILSLTPEQIDEMAERLRAVKWVEHDVYYDADWIRLGEPLPLILNGQRTVMPEMPDYHEWAYFSNKLFEVWAGHNMITTFPFAELTEDRVVCAGNDFLDAWMNGFRASRDGDYDEDDDEEEEGDEEDAGDDGDDDEDGLKTAASQQQGAMLAVFDNAQVKTVPPATDAILAGCVGGSSSSVITNDAAATGGAAKGREA